MSDTISADIRGLSPKWGNDVEVHGAITVASIIDAVRSSRRDTFYVPRDVYDFLRAYLMQDIGIEISSFYISTVRILPLEAAR